MSVKWGTAKGASGESKFKVGINLLIPTPGRTDTQVTITTELWVWTRDKFNDTDNLMSWSGSAFSAAGSQAVPVITFSESNWSKRNKIKVLTFTRVVPTTYLDQQITATVSLTGIDEAGSATVASYTRTGTLFASPFDPPDAPTGCAVTRVSDTAQKVTWVNTNATSASKPYFGLRVQRWDNVTNAWYEIAQVGVQDSFTDTTTSLDRRYQYRVQAYNGGGSSAFSTSGTIETTPIPPTGVKASRPLTSVAVTWTNVSTIATTVEVWHSENGVMDAAPLATVSASTTSYTHTSASMTSDHLYYLKAVAVRTSTLSGASPEVAKAATPNSPTILGPRSGIEDITSDIRLSWQHAPSDGTSQTSFKVRWRQQGTSVWSLPDGQALSATASASTDLITCAGHGLNTGDIVRFEGDPPAPLAVGAQYFAIVTSGSQFKVSTSDEEDALAINLTTAGGSFSVLNGVTVSNAQAYTIPANSLLAGRSYEWMVRTNGRFADAEPSGPWSRSAGFRGGTKPTLTIEYPDTGATVDTPQAMVAWTFFSPDAGVKQQWAQASLYQDGQRLEIYESDGDWSTVTFATDLTNGTSYVAHILTEGTNGLRSDEAVIAFDVEFVAPVSPGGVLEWDGTEGRVLITVGNPDDLDAPVAVSNKVEWLNPDTSQWETLKSGLPTNTAMYHYLPVPNATNTYQITATSEGGTTYKYVLSIDCDNSGDWYWINGGNAYSQVAKVRYGAATGVKFEAQKELQIFAGRNRPVEFSGPNRTHTVNLSAILPRDLEGYTTKAELVNLADLGGPVYYRDPTGMRLKCSLGELTFDEGDSTIEFQTTLTEVDIRAV